jgi:hypothetical protein
MKPVLSFLEIFFVEHNLLSSPTNVPNILVASFVKKYDQDQLFSCKEESSESLDLHNSVGSSFQLFGSATIMASL